jgi:aspartyl protease family protein
MGTFAITIEAGDPQARRFRSIEALVDTGASYTTLPGSLLRELGVASHGQRPFLLAAGDTVVRDIGRTWVRISGQTEMTIVVFGDDGASALLGAVTLEEFGLGVDTIARKLIPVPGLLT